MNEPKQVCVPAPAIDDRCEEWVATYDNDNGYAWFGSDVATGVAMSPDGDVLFVTGYSWDQDTGNRPLPGCGECFSTETHWDVATAAYSATTGAPLWSSRFNGAENYGDGGFALAVSPDGSRVYVTGLTDSSGGIYFASSDGDLLTLAYGAGDGRLLWSRRYDGGKADWGFHAAASPVGDRIYITGYGYVGLGGSSDWNVVTLAYEGASGDLLWSAGYDGPGRSYDLPRGITVSPDGERVYVAGMSQGTPGPFEWRALDYFAAAYDAGLMDDPDDPDGQRGGSQLWASRFNGDANAYDAAADLAVSADGSTIYVAGTSDAGEEGTTPTDICDDCDFTTVAYSSDAGVRLWDARYDRLDGIDVAAALATAEAGDGVFVSGVEFPNGFATLSYDGRTGAQRWMSRYLRPDATVTGPADIAVHPDGSAVFVAGESVVGLGQGPPAKWIQGNSATIAYETNAGTQLWVGVHNSSPVYLDGYAEPNGVPFASLAVDPGGRRVALARTFAYTVSTVPPGPGPQEGNYFDYGVLSYPALG